MGFHRGGCRHQPWGPNDEADTRQFIVDALAAWTNTASTRRVGSGPLSSDTNRRGHRSGRTENPQRGSPTGGDLVCGSYCSLVRGLVDPLRDPRTSQLVVAVGRYRRCDGVAVHSTDAGWRVAIKTGSPLSYLQGDPSHPMLESDDVAAGAIEQMASTGGILADLFVRDQVA